MEIPGNDFGVPDVEIPPVGPKVYNGGAVASQEQGLTLINVVLAPIDAQFCSAVDIQVGFEVVRAGVGGAVPFLLLENRQRKQSTCNVIDPYF